MLETKGVGIPEGKVEVLVERETVRTLEEVRPQARTLKAIMDRYHLCRKVRRASLHITATGASHRTATFAEPRSVSDSVVRLQVAGGVDG